MAAGRRKNGLFSCPGPCGHPACPSRTRWPRPCPWRGPGREIGRKMASLPVAAGIGPLRAACGRRRGIEGKRIRPCDGEKRGTAVSGLRPGGGASSVFPDMRHSKGFQKNINMRFFYPRYIVLFRGTPPGSQEQNPPALVGIVRKTLACDRYAAGSTTAATSPISQGSRPATGAQAAWIRLPMPPQGRGQGTEALPSRS